MILILNCREVDDSRLNIMVRNTMIRMALRYMVQTFLFKMVFLGIACREGVRQKMRYGKEVCSG